MDRAAAKRFGCAAVALTVAGTAMFSVTSATRVLVATTPVDLRGSFNRLYSMVVEQLKGDPLSGRLLAGYAPCVKANGKRSIFLTKCVYTSLTKKDLSSSSLKLPML